MLLHQFITVAKNDSLGPTWNPKPRQITRIVAMGAAKGRMKRTIAGTDTTWEKVMLTTAAVIMYGKSTLEKRTSIVEVYNVNARKQNIKVVVLGRCFVRVGYCVLLFVVVMVCSTGIVRVCGGVNYIVAIE